MVHHLISALSSLSDEDNNAIAGACNDDSSTTALEHSLLVRIGTAIKLPRVVSLIQTSRRQHLFDTPPSTASLSPKQRLMPSRVIGSITSSFATLMSPQRQKTRHSLDDAQATSAAIPVTSPRNWIDSKRSRTSPPVNAAITNSMEWGRCHLSEFAHFSAGDQFIIIIPADHKNDSKNSITQRRAIRDRIIESVATGLADDTSPDMYRAPHRTLTNAARKKEAHEHLLQHHGIERKKKVYIELRCCLQRYPHRDNFINNSIPRKEIEHLFRQNEGVYVSLLNFNEYVVNMRWNDLPFIQVWLPYSRSDHRPLISIQSKRQSKKYLPELMGLYNAYKDDGNRMCELLLTHHEKKSEYHLAQLRDCRKENTRLLQQSEHHVVDVYNANVLHDEMTDHRLPHFVGNVDKMYYDAWVDHYSSFHPNTPLLLNTQMIEIYKTIESTFPCHFRCFGALFFASYANVTVITSFIGHWLPQLPCITVAPTMRLSATILGELPQWTFELHLKNWKLYLWKLRPIEWRSSHPNNL